jgi:glycosyltransferase involved in cell wall biosynthesis
MADFFSIVVPIHNEADFLQSAVADLRAELATVSANPEIYLVENGSTDETLSIAQRLAKGQEGLVVLTLPQPDYGAAIRAGLLAASGDWVVTFDLDYYSGRFIDQLREVRDRADVVIASKRAPGSEDHRSLVRRSGTRVFNVLVRTMLGTHVSDTHGIKAFARVVIDELADRVISTKDLFDTELVVRAERSGFRIVEVPVTVQEQREARSSYVRRVPRALAGLVQLRSVLSKERRNTTSR